jgi:hypothetical protein
MPTRHHVKTLAATFSWTNLKTLATHEVLAQPRTAFHPCICGLRRGTNTIVVVLIDYDNVRLLPRRPRGGDDRDRLLPLHQHATMLNCYSNSFFVALRI